MRLRLKHPDENPLQMINWRTFSFKDADLTESPVGDWLKLQCLWHAALHASGVAAGSRLKPLASLRLGVNHREGEGRAKRDVNREHVSDVRRDKDFPSQRPKGRRQSFGRGSRLTSRFARPSPPPPPRFEGNILQLLENAVLFIGHHSRKPWRIYGMERKEHPDSPEAGVREAVTNALIHRDYMIVGSEIHIDIYPDRLEITSPGGMVDGTRIQDRDITNVPSMRRNKIISDIFGRLKLMDRRGSGFERMVRGYAGSNKVPEFISDVSSFRVVFPNMNYQPETADGQSEAVPKGEVPLAEIPAADVSSTEGTGESPSMQPFMDLSPKEMGVLSQMKNTPGISIRKLAGLQNLSVKEVRTLVSSLRKRGIIEHVGANNGGFWRIR